MNSSEMFSFTANLFYDKRYIGADGYATVYFQVIINSKHKNFNQKLRWPVDKFNKVKNVLEPRHPEDNECYDYNLILKGELAKYTEIQTTYRLRKEPLDLAKFTKEVKGFDQKACFHLYMLNESERLYQEKIIEKKTRDNVRAVRRLVMEYDPLSLYANIDLKWMTGFKSFLQRKQYKPGKFYKPGNVWDRIKFVKAYLKKASEEPMIYVREEVHKFPNPNPETETTFLNHAELKALMDLERSKGLTDVQYAVLRAFLFTCFTSLRISDVYRVGSRWLVGSSYLKFIPQKNFKKRRELKIPITPIAKQFINKTKRLYFDLPTSQEYNRTLKDLAFMVKINKSIHAHVGRHTFGYLYMTTVGNIYGLQEILGHQRIETTQRYAHLDEEYQLKSVKKMQKGFDKYLMRPAG